MASGRERTQLFSLRTGDKGDVSTQGFPTAAFFAVLTLGKLSGEAAQPAFALIFAEQLVIDRQHRAAGIAEDEFDALLCQRIDQDSRAAALLRHGFSPSSVGSSQHPLSMSIMEQIRCGIIGANSDDVAMLEMVLRAIDPQHQFLSIESRIQPELNRLFLDDVDVALIHNPKNITEEGVKDLEKFLRSGGGVIWFQGNEDGSEFHPDIFDKIGFPFPEKRMNAGQGFFSTQIAGEYSDLLQDLQVRNLDSELPEVFNYIQTKLDAKQKVHWTLNNSDPLLIEFSKGSGSIFYFSTLLDLRWNDLAIRGMLVPLIYRLLVLTGTDEINTSSVNINEPKWISVEEKYLRHKWEIVSPSGRTEMIVPEYDREGINILSTDELGVYTVYSNGELFTSFPTRLHDQEYIQNRFSQNDIESILPSNQTRWLTLKDEFSQVFMETRQGKSLWKIFLALAILFLLAESIIGRPVRANLKAEDS